MQVNLRGSFFTSGLVFGDCKCEKKERDKMNSCGKFCRSEDERDAAIQRVEELQEVLDGIQKKSKERSKKVRFHCQYYL